MAVFFIKKIWKKASDDSAHRQFIRFSKGIFENKAVLNIGRNGKIKISGTYDCVTDAVAFIASLTAKVNVSGLVISRTAIPGIHGNEKKGAISYNFNEELDSKKLLEITKASIYALLDCEASGIELKTKKTIPRPGSRSSDKVNDKFFTASIDIKFWPQVKEEFLFDLPEGKKYRLSHKYEISSIILPKGEKDFEKMRLMAKKKGRMTRTAEIDGKTISQEIDFEA
jgi:hypothetical protein